MSIPGRDNESPEQRRKLNRENQKASAKGNMSVVSRAGGSEQQEPQLRSVNEPQIGVPAPQIAKPAELLTKEQIGKNREANKQAALAAAVQQGLTLPATERVVETSTLGPMDQMGYNTDSYNEAAARERLNNASWLKDMNDRAEALNKEYEAKAKKASQSAKAAAWGNLFRALGQLAGAGKNTYVKPESKYLTDAMTKADKAREVYEAIKVSNQKSIDEAKAKWLANDQALFYKDKESYNKAVENYNKEQREIAKATGSKTKTTYNNDDAYRAAELGIKQQNANAATKRAAASERNAELNQVKANQKADADSKKARNSAYINFKDRGIGKEYYLNESEALEVANKMIVSGEYTGRKLGLLSSYISGTLQDTDKAQLKSSILGYLEANKDNPEIASILNTAQYGTFEIAEENDL